MNDCKPQAAHDSLCAKQSGAIWIPLLLALLTVLASCAAAWQYQRYQYHQQLIAVAADNARAGEQAAPVSINQLNGAAVQFLQTLTVTGQWLPNSAVDIAPRLVDGRMGAWRVQVLSYVDSAGKTRHLAVHRGWLAQGQTIQITDPTTTQTSDQKALGLVQLTGFVTAALGKAFELKADAHTRLGTWQNYSLTDHAKLTNLTLDPLILVQTDKPTGADAPFIRANPEQERLTLQDKTNKNWGYMLQWLGLALVGAVGLLWMLVSSRRQKAKIM